MSEFHEIIAESFEHADTSALRQYMVDWYLAKEWPRNRTNLVFASMWANGQFDSLEARCGELIYSRRE